MSWLAHVVSATWAVLAARFLWAHPWIPLVLTPPAVIGAWWWLHTWPERH